MMLIKGIVVSLLVCFIITSGEDSDEVDTDAMDPKKLWNPPNGLSREQFFRCRGMKCDVWRRRQLKLLYLNYISKRQENEETKDTEIDHPGIMSSGALEIANLEKDACAHLTERQIDQMIAEMKGNSTRVKRKLYNRIYAESLWETPIVWKFDGAHSDGERRMVREAFIEWERLTCLSFIEIGTKTPYNDNHLLLTRSDDGCYAYMGRVKELNPQIVNLGSGCFFAFGVSLHEIGHSLGLFHEHQRSDRDDYININLQNLNVFQAQFAQYQTVNLASYDFSSVMHYAPKSFSYNNKPIISPQDKLYLHNMGQRVGLSFSDAKTINISPYCKMECNGISLEQPCQRNGYQDPFDCSICRCPPGFGGKFCETIAPPENENCGGIIYLKNTVAIKSPGYPNTHYQNNIECNWFVKSPPNTIIQLIFEGPFGVYKFDPTDSCYHWVEVKYKDNLKTTGPRFCGTIPPQVKLKSSKNEMLIMLRSHYHVSQTRARRGFAAVVSVVNQRKEVTGQKKKFKCIIYKYSGRKYCYRYACKMMKWAKKRQCYKYWCITKVGSKGGRCFKRKVNVKTKNNLGVFKTKSVNVPIVNTSETPIIPVTTTKNMVCIGPVGKRFCYIKNVMSKLHMNHNKQARDIFNNNLIGRDFESRSNIGRRDPVQQPSNYARLICETNKDTGKKFCYRKWTSFIKNTNKTKDTTSPQRSTNVSPTDTFTFTASTTTTTAASTTKPPQTTSLTTITSAASTSMTPPKKPSRSRLVCINSKKTGRRFCYRERSNRMLIRKTENDKSTTMTVASTEMKPSSTVISKTITSTAISKITSAAPSTTKPPQTTKPSLTTIIDATSTNMTPPSGNRPRLVCINSKKTGRRFCYRTRSNRRLISKTQNDKSTIITAASTEMKPSPTAISISTVPSTTTKLPQTTKPSLTSITDAASKTMTPPKKPLGNQPRLVCINSKKTGRRFCYRTRSNRRLISKTKNDKSTIITAASTEMKPSPTAISISTIPSTTTKLPQTTKPSLTSITDAASKTMTPPKKPLGNQPRLVCINSKKTGRRFCYRTRSNRRLISKTKNDKSTIITAASTEMKPSPTAISISTVPSTTTKLSETTKPSLTSITDAASKTMTPPKKPSGNQPRLVCIKMKKTGRRYCFRTRSNRRLINKTQNEKLTTTMTVTATETIPFTTSTTSLQTTWTPPTKKTSDSYSPLVCVKSKKSGQRYYCFRRMKKSY